jgi:hypothetical protein
MQILAESPDKNLLAGRPWSLVKNEINFKLERPEIRSSSKKP